jgi:hypothetical protein
LKLVSKPVFSDISVEIVKGFSFVLIKWPLIHQKKKKREVGDYYHHISVA